MNQVARRQDSQMTKVSPRDLIEQKSKMMIAALPGTKTAQKRFMQAAMGVASQPGIATCEPNSVLKAIYQCARLNLIPDPILHHVAIVPFRNKGKKEATVIIEYRGLIELMKRANPALSIKAGTVYANDDYELIEGTVDLLKITKRWWEKGKKDPGDPLLHYAVVREPGAEPVTVFVPRVEAKKIGDESKAGCKPGTPWHDHPVPMGEKTAIKRIERFVRMDPDKEETKQFREALEVDDRTDELPDMADDTDIMGAMGGGEPDVEDLSEGASRIGQVVDFGKPGDPREKKVVLTERSRAPGAGDAFVTTQAPSSTPPPDSSLAPAAIASPSAPPNNTHTAVDKKKFGAVIDLQLSEAGMEPTAGNRYKLMQHVADVADFAKDAVGATTEQMDQWRENAKSMSPEQVRALFGPPAAAPEAKQIRSPFQRVVNAWSIKAGISPNSAGEGARRLLMFKYEIDPDDLGEDDVTEKIIEQINDGTTNLARYEKG